MDERPLAPELRAFMSRAKRVIRNGIRHLPGEGRMIVHAYRQTLLARRVIGSKLRSARGDGQPDPETIYYIDPARIVYHTNHQPRGKELAARDRVFDMQRDRGKVHGGSWDVPAIAFAELDVVRALRQRIEEQREWQDTEFYARLCNELRVEKSSGWNIRSRADVDARCQFLDHLIESIRREGYLRSNAVALAGEDKGLQGHPVYGEEVSVNIGRDGQYLFQNGRHRLAIAQILRIAKIPVKVLVRHKQWVEFRNFLSALAGKAAAVSGRTALYQNPIHPDLQDLPFEHACEDRLEALRKHAGPGSGAVLDIGANLGYFCHGFEALGYSCYALEHFDLLALAADRIRIAENRTFTVVREDLFVAAQREPLRDRRFEIVLALNIFHHFLKERELFEKFTAWLSRLQVETMFFEPHCAREPQMTGAHVNFDEREFVDFVLANSMLNHAELVYRCHDGRPIYRLWR